ncbi:imidazole glycerol phosphate synthase subunit HisH [Laribacter hongkongensis]|uniref:imidazole glycerol phosphate synthase subunit HisH n=1 Tax=Laribacter hongkongensis TaxID=168471 RepID=UPI0004118FD1|nr:imidazole glycerol phosphate synthase subunit HisH [Laribacter hongkongensis]
MSASNRIAVVDYGMGNLRSVVQALGHVAGRRAEVMLTSDPAVVSAADRVVFPGQGAMRDCMAELAASGLRQAVLDAARSKPFFGICVGAQLLLEHSEEGDTPALGFFPGNVRRFASGQTTADGARLKVPHMGWNEVRQVRPHPLFAGVDDAARFYFVHSYYMAPARAELALGLTDYPQPFASVIGGGNVFATQFHPEKSTDAGLQLLRNFVDWDGQAG